MRGGWRGWCCQGLNFGILREYELVMTGQEADGFRNCTIS